MKLIFQLLILLYITTNFAQNTTLFNNCGVDELFDNNKLYDENFETFYQKQLISQSKNPVTYYIPVVFHVIHTGEAIGEGSNLSDASIYKALKGLNDHYKNNHNYSSNSNTNIQFVLATKAPNGNCSTGINRINFGYNAIYKQYGNKWESTNNGVDAATIRALSNWSPNNYYNIWVVNKITSNTNVTAYAYYPEEHGKIHDGTFISANAVNLEYSSILAHELGHSLNLKHTFQGSTGTNCPSQINGCGTDGDCVADTPPHILDHVKDLNINAFNSCSSDNNSTFKHNYMTYTYIGNMNAFTPMQITRMQSAINFYRSSYLPHNNSVFTMNQPPQAKFMVNYDNTLTKQLFCAGASIALINTSSCFLNTFNDSTVNNYTSFWEIKLNNQTVLTSTQPNPVITLNQTGIYSITLTVTNNIGKNTYTQNNAIEIVSNPTTSYCIPQTSFISNYNCNIANVKLNRINNTTKLSENEGYQNFSCTHITQVSSTATNQIWITPTFTNNNLGSTMYISGYIDYNDNGVFEPNENIFSSTISQGSKHIKYPFNFTAPTNVKQVKVLRMRIASDSNPININHINCFNTFNIGDIEDYGVIFVQNLSNEEFNDSSIKIYPNPTNDFLNIALPHDDIKELEVYDMAGKLIISKKISGKSYRLDIQYLSNGNYILKINNSSHKFIKQ